MMIGMFGKNLVGFDVVVTGTLLTFFAPQLFLEVEAAVGRLPTPSFRGV